MRHQVRNPVLTAGTPSRVDGMLPGIGQLMAQRDSDGNWWFGLPEAMTAAQDAMSLDARLAAKGWSRGAIDFAGDEILKAQFIRQFAS
jgi:hypothetical protein